MNIAPVDYIDRAFDHKVIGHGISFQFQFQLQTSRAIEHASITRLVSPITVGFQRSVLLRTVLRLKFPIFSPNQLTFNPSSVTTIFFFRIPVFNSFDVSLDKLTVDCIKISPKHF